MTGAGWVETALEQLKGARVTVFGDFCLDAYWPLATDANPVSLETGLPVRRVLAQRYSLGGAGNVAANLSALGVRQVRVVGAIGGDLFGQEVRRLLIEAGVDTSGLLTLAAPWQTMTYAKPYLGDAEESRIDFGAFNVLSAAASDALIAALDRLAAVSDAVVLNQQVACPGDRGRSIERINQVIAHHPRTPFIVDARDTAGAYSGALLKLNAREASRLLGEARADEGPIRVAEARSLAERLFERTGRPVFLTRGEYGLLAADAGGVHEIAGIQTTTRTDPVGAGDTVVAALAAVLGSGGDVLTAARLANIAASITVRKIQTTGTATAAEIRAAAADLDLVYEPELADDERQARYSEGTEFEIIHPLPAEIRIGHAIFDHDGTLSTLREGWEQIMQPMMERAILGRHYRDATPALYEKVQTMVRRFIGKTTGIQTLVQMQGLVELVRQFGLVAEGEILDEQGYKRIYNDQLLTMVRERVGKLEGGELAPGDFQIKNADLLLRRLSARGVKLYLASGTDEADVVAEARALGYADRFEGRIYGAVGDVKTEAKKVVLERIMGENGLSGEEFVVFGDGPVEMREARKRHGIAIGLCSDEVRRFGRNPAKRARLIRGGASLLIPDFSQIGALLKLLNLN